MFQRKMKNPILTRRSWLWSLFLFHYERSKYPLYTGHLRSKRIELMILLCVHASCWRIVLFVFILRFVARKLRNWFCFFVIFTMVFLCILLSRKVFPVSVHNSIDMRYCQSWNEWVWHEISVSINFIRQFPKINLSNRSHLDRYYIMSMMMWRFKANIDRFKWLRALVIIRSWVVIHTSVTDNEKNWKDVETVLIS